MSLTINTTTIPTSGNVYVNGNPMQKVYLNSTLVWSKAPARTWKQIRSGVFYLMEDGQTGFPNLNGVPGGTLIPSTISQTIPSTQLTNYTASSSDFYLSFNVFALPIIQDGGGPKGDIEYIQHINTNPPTTASGPMISAYHVPYRADSGYIDLYLYPPEALSNGIKLTADIAIDVTGQYNAYVLYNFEINSIYQLS